MIYRNLFSNCFVADEKHDYSIKMIYVFLFKYIKFYSLIDNQLFIESDNCLQRMLRLEKHELLIVLIVINNATMSLYAYVCNILPYYELWVTLIHIMILNAKIIFGDIFTKRVFSYVSVQSQTIKKLKPQLISAVIWHFIFI